LYILVEQKFPEWILVETIKERGNNNWTVEDFLTSIDGILKMRELAFSLKNAFSERKSHREDVMVAEGNTYRTSSCLFCDQGHSTANCRKYATRDSRLKRLSELKRCFRCFCEGHIIRECTKTIKCPKCSGRHQAAFCEKSESAHYAEISNQEVNELLREEVSTIEPIEPTFAEGYYVEIITDDIPMFGMHTAKEMVAEDGWKFTESQPRTRKQRQIENKMKRLNGENIG
jgi:hypothetical protein